MAHSGTFSVQRREEDVCELLADPQQFAPLFPDFESLETQDATHFKLRTVIAAGLVRGDATLAMERYEASKPRAVGYRGEGIIAGGQLRMQMDFAIGANGIEAQVHWQGWVSLESALALIASHVIETLGREKFGRMAVH